MSYRTALFSTEGFSSDVSFHRLVCHWQLCRSRCRDETDWAFITFIEYAESTTDSRFARSRRHWKDAANHRVCSKARAEIHSDSMIEWQQSRYVCAKSRDICRVCRNRWNTTVDRRHYRTELWATEKDECRSQIICSRWKSSMTSYFWQRRPRLSNEDWKSTNLWHQILLIDCRSWLDADHDTISSCWRTWVENESDERESKTRMSDSAE